MSPALPIPVKSAVVGYNQSASASYTLTIDPVPVAPIPVLSFIAGSGSTSVGGTFTNLASGNAVITGGSINGTPIGATTASTGAFTTLSSSGAFTASGNIVAGSGTASTSTTTGALVVVGGAGISGNVFLG